MNGRDRNLFHEAGHVFVIRHTGVNLNRAYSICEESSSGATYISGEAIPTNVDDLKTDRSHDLCMIAVAGCVAERIASGRGQMSDKDEKWARPAAYHALRSSGRFEQIDNDEDEVKISLVDNYIEQVINEVEILLRDNSNWVRVQAIAKRLAIGSISGNTEVDHLMSV